MFQTAHSDSRRQQERERGFPRLPGEAGCQEQRERGERYQGVPAAGTRRHPNEPGVVQRHSVHKGTIVNRSRERHHTERQVYNASVKSPMQTGKLKTLTLNRKLYQCS